MSIVLPLGLLSTPCEATPIEIQVEVTEIDQSKASRLGMEMNRALDFSEQAPPGILSIGRIERITTLQSQIHFLMEEGAAELLANPNLVTNSGSKAEFQAGGEIPYITNAGLGAAHVEFKPYGVLLQVEPTLLKDGQIQISLEAGVSSPDLTNGVGLSGNTVPALLERKVKSHVTVQPGTTITIAGLVQTHKEKSEGGVPFFRRLPLIGWIFRWKKENFRKTTIVVFVTPKLITL